MVTGYPLCFTEKKERIMYDNMELKTAMTALGDDVMVEDAVDSPTSIPCGITISITLNC